MQNFSERLRTAIAQSATPKGVLAQRAGVAHSTVSRWLSGSVPSYDMAVRIGTILGVDAKWLLTGESADAKDARDFVKEEAPAYYYAPALGGPSVPSLVQAIRQASARLEIEGDPVMRAGLAAHLKTLATLLEEKELERIAAG